MKPGSCIGAASSAAGARSNACVHGSPIPTDRDRRSARPAGKRRGRSRHASDAYEAVVRPVESPDGRPISTRSPGKSPSWRPTIDQARPDSKLCRQSPCRGWRRVASSIPLSSAALGVAAVFQDKQPPPDARAVGPANSRQDHADSVAGCFSYHRLPLPPSSLPKHEHAEHIWELGVRLIVSLPLVLAAPGLYPAAVCFRALSDHRLAADPDPDFHVAPGRTRSRCR